MTMKNPYIISLLENLINKFVQKHGVTGTKERFLNFFIKNGVCMAKFNVYETVNIASKDNSELPQTVTVSGIITGAPKSKIMYFIIKDPENLNSQLAVFEAQLCKLNEPFVPLNYENSYSKANVDADASEDNETKLKRVLDEITIDFSTFLSCSHTAAEYLVDKGAVVSKYIPYEAVYITDNYDVVNDCSSYGAPNEKIEPRIRECAVLSSIFKSVMGPPSYLVIPKTLTHKERDGTLNFDWESFFPEWALSKTKKEAERYLSK